MRFVSDVDNGDCAGGDFAAAFAFAAVVVAPGALLPAATDIEAVGARNAGDADEAVVDVDVGLAADRPLAEPVAEAEPEPVKFCDDSALVRPEGVVLGAALPLPLLPELLIRGDASAFSVFIGRSSSSSSESFTVDSL